MQWLLCGVVVLGACSSSPDMCDSDVVASVANVAWQLGFPVGSAGSRQGAFTCSGGGSGTLAVEGINQWDGNFVFEACTMPAHRYRITDPVGTLTLTGTLMFQGDATNVVDFGSASALTIRGTVATCAAPIDETCAASWGVQQSDTTGEFYRVGTLCGRHFP